MIVTIGCPRPALTMQLLAQALGATSATTASSNRHELAVKVSATAAHQDTKIRCLPSPFPRILAIQRECSRASSAMAKEEETSLQKGVGAERGVGLRQRVQGWGTFIRHRGQIPLEYCYPDIPVSLDVGESTAGSTETEDPLTSPYIDGQLKEIAIPDPGGRLLETLEQHTSIQRMVTGVYGIKPGKSASSKALPCYIRPLPIALQDHRIPIPTLVFHHLGPSSQHQRIQPTPDAWSRIGDRGGSAQGGQWMHTILQDRDLLDVRLCSSTKTPTSMFMEAQTSLLAGSLDGLQSNRVLDADTTHSDTRTNRADCWIEVREQAVQKLRPKPDSTSPVV